MTASSSTSIPLVDERVLATLRRALDAGPECRRVGDGSVTSALARASVVAILVPEDHVEERVPDFAPGALVAEVPELDVPAMVLRLVEECPEIEIPDSCVERVEVVWRLKAGKHHGAVSLGSLRPIGKRERLTYPGQGDAPWWRLTIGLDTWCLLTPDERWQLVHHELCHATFKGDESSPTGPAGKGHDIEEFAANIARYGLGDGLRAAAVAQAMARPRIREELRVWEMDPQSGQGLLFGRDLAPVGWGEGADDGEESYACYDALPVAP